VHHFTLSGKLALEKFIERKVVCWCVGETGEWNGFVSTAFVPQRSDRTLGVPTLWEEIWTVGHPNTCKKDSSMSRHERKDAVISVLVCVCGVVKWIILRCLYACNKVDMNSHYSMYIDVDAGTVIRTAMSVQMRMYGSKYEFCLWDLDGCILILSVNSLPKVMQRR